MNFLETVMQKMAQDLTPFDIYVANGRDLSKLKQTDREKVLRDYATGDDELKLKYVPNDETKLSNSINEQRVNFENEVNNYLKNIEKEQLQKGILNNLKDIGYAGAGAGLGGLAGWNLAGLFTNNDVAKGIAAALGATALGTAGYNYGNESQRYLTDKATNAYNYLTTPAAEKAVTI